MLITVAFSLTFFIGAFPTCTCKKTYFKHLQKYHVNPQEEGERERDRESKEKTENDKITTKLLNFQYISNDNVYCMYLSVEFWNENLYNKIITYR